MVQKIHFIAIGGSAMHNLALALKNNGHEITGSDDEIFEPSASRLAANGLLPSAFGWFPEKITSELDAVILGMHAKADNPELLKAQELGVPIFSYPEFVYQQSINKQRVVIAGSHGKTTITSMILHVLKYVGKPFDYLVGAKLEGFDTMVQFSDAPIIVIEGDEYLSSPIDRRPKFAHYHHHIGVISGISWDHINVYPSFENYRAQFVDFVEKTPKSGTLIFNSDDNEVTNIAQATKTDDVEYKGYSVHSHEIKGGITYLIDVEGKKHPIKIFGEHNLLNISAAAAVVDHLGVEPRDFYKAIQTFEGAANRLEILAKANGNIVYKDFAHAPSKLAATTKAVSLQHADKKIIACLELHTFSSLNKEFLAQYRNTYNSPQVAIVYYNPLTLAHKNLAPISENEIKDAFNNANIQVFTDSNTLKNYLLSLKNDNNIYLLMSSGNFDGLNLKEFAQELI